MSLAKFIIKSLLIISFFLPVIAFSKMADAIQVKEPIYDFGLILDRTKTLLSHKFKLENVTSNDVFVREVITSCSCTVLTTQKFIIAANNNFELESILSIEDITGEKSSSIEIVYDDGSKTELELRVALSTITRPVPERPTFQLKKDNKGLFSFEAYKSYVATGVPKSFQQIKFQFPSSKVLFRTKEVYPEVTSEQLHVYRYLIEVEIPEPINDKLANGLIMEFADGEKIEVPIVIEVKPPLYFEPIKIFAGRVKKDSVQKVELILKGDVNVGVRKLLLEGKVISFDWVGKKSQERKMALSVQWDLPRGFQQLNGQAIFEDTNQVTVPFSIVALVAE